MSALSVLENSLLHEVAADVAIVTVDVESELLRVTFKNAAHIKLSLPYVLPVVDQIVHLPKLALQSRGFGCRRGGESVLVWRNEGKLAEGHANFIAKLSFHLFQDRVKQAARGTLKIT